MADKLKTIKTHFFDISALMKLVIDEENSVSCKNDLLRAIHSSSMSMSYTVFRCRYLRFLA